jgi:Tfp pilus assembly protein PilO
MKASDRAILFAVAGVALIAVFWLLVLSPKRAEVSDLGAHVSELRASVSAAEQEAATAEQAKSDYAANYHNLVVLGKAVPSEEDTSSLLVQIQALAARSGIGFDALNLSDSSDQAAPPTAASQTTADPSASDSTGSGEAVPAEQPTTVPATEAAAATLPLGATVGSAGLPVMPYDLTFNGDFFQVADFIQGLNKLVRTQSAGIGVDGRLLTIDGFSLGPDEQKPLPHLVASLHVTSYVAPGDQAGSPAAAPAAPTEAVPPSTATPASNTTISP